MVYVCFVDFSKAYETVWRVGLFYKLIKYGFYKLIKYGLSLKYTKLIENMYNNIQYAVKLSDGITPFLSSTMGVRQGCNLSPMLFNLLINDINKIFEDNIYDPIHIKDYNVSCLLYVDDLLLMFETESGLIHCLKSLNKYMEKWSLTISEKKKNTKIMIFNKSGHLRTMSVRIGDLNIKSCSEYTYLGTLLTPAGTSFKNAQNELVKKARKSMFGYLKEINIFQGAQPKIMLKLFNTLVTPILTYHSEIWGSFMKPNQLRNFDTFIKNLFDDKMAHEILQLKSGKIIL